MLATQTELDVLADRIERTYRLRRPGWHGGCSSERVWSVAAATLLGAHKDDRSLPPDPELFVAALPEGASYSDPWVELTQADALRCYKRRVARIIRGLRAELTAEVSLAESRIGSGQSVGKVLLARSRRLSPLGRFIVAQRAGRSALAGRFLPAAVAQHESCPLYRQASAGLLPAQAYPVPEGVGPVSSQLAPGPGRSRNPLPLN